MTNKIAALIKQYEEKIPEIDIFINTLNDGKHAIGVHHLHGVDTFILSGPLDEFMLNETLEFACMAIEKKYKKNNGKEDRSK